MNSGPDPQLQREILERQRMAWNAKLLLAFGNLPADQRRNLLTFYRTFMPQEISERVELAPEIIRQSAFDGLARLLDAIQEANRSQASDLDRSEKTQRLG
jgi:hypothetical protein